MQSSSFGIYRLKVITFFNRKVPILLQNENGPCPLLAICNILLLRNQLRIRAEDGFVTLEELIQRVANILFETNSKLVASNEEFAANARDQLDDAITLLPKLGSGLDVNLHFCSASGCTGFEYTTGFIPFDLLDITLVHGWLVDPQDDPTVAVMSDMSYNHAVECLISLQSGGGHSKDSSPRSTNLPHPGDTQNDGTDARDETQNASATRVQGEQDGEHSQIQVLGEDIGTNTSTSTDLSANESTAKQETVEVAKVEGDTEENSEASRRASKAMIVQAFMDDNASQLTYYGLMKLHQTLRERQLAVFFRNNHFSTIFKYDKSLYLLATDVGFAEEPNVVWEKLDEIDGDTEYVNHVFTSPESVEEPKLGERNLDEQDPSYLLALEISAEEERLNTARRQGISSNPVSVTQDFITHSPSHNTIIDIPSTQQQNQSIGNRPIPPQYDGTTKVVGVAENVRTVSVAPESHPPPPPSADINVQSQYDADEDLARKLQYELNHGDFSIQPFDNSNQPNLSDYEISQQLQRQEYARTKVPNKLQEQELTGPPKRSQLAAPPREESAHSTEDGSDKNSCNIM